MAIIEINKIKKRIKIGKTLFEMANELKLALPSSCQQQGKCKECLIEVKSGQQFISKKNKEERHLSDPFRLGCQAIITQDGDISCQTLKRGQIFIEEASSLSLNQYDIHPAVIRSGNNVLLDGQKIDTYQGQILGLAIDIGTTTVVIKLIDLERGKELTSSSFENPQRYAGSNVMSRIVYDTQLGKKELKRILTLHLTTAINALTKTPELIYEVMIGGNTTMRDLFFGLDVSSIGQTPYISVSEQHLKEKKVTTTALSSSGKKMRLPICPNARVYGLPLIGSHVGADTVATLLAIDFEQEDHLIAVMDIGTNTEIVLGNHKKSYSASSPSGPAFEGGGISCGMPALPGAIEKIKINDNGKIDYSTVKGKPAVGICGSGLIDILGELLRTEQINEVGRLEDDLSRFNITKDVFISENDINLLAQTKGANASALNLLLKKAKSDFSDIHTFYLAGGFGKHINIEAAIRIGLLPDIPRERFIQIGNAAVEGLVRALLSKPKRDLYESFVQQISIINLEADPDFFDHFVNGCLFIPLENSIL